MSAAPYARSVGSVSLVSEMNWVVMFGMVFMGSVSCLLGNRRRPFFIWGAGALACGFALLAFVPSVFGISRAAYLMIGAGYGVTSVLLAGTKECVAPAYMASAIGFANFFANIVQIGGNQLSGRLMAYGAEGYPWIFMMYFVLALTSFVLALRKGETIEN